MMDIASPQLANSGKRWSVGQILVLLLGVALLLWGALAFFLIRFVHG